MLDSSKSIDLNFYQIGKKDQYSSYYSSETNVLYEDIYSESQCEEYSHGELYETFISSKLSDSSSKNEPDNCNINSQYKYSFYIKVNDLFNSFKEIGKKLDKYAIECGLAVRKGIHVHMRIVLFGMLLEDQPISIDSKFHLFIVRQLVN
ncbi:25197_t:CDS:2, partial [Gigaspora margarita]